jgi:hypothetical protein
MKPRWLPFIPKLVLSVALAPLALAGNNSPNLMKLEKGWRLVSASDVRVDGAALRVLRWYNNALRSP